MSLSALVNSPPPSPPKRLSQPEPQRPAAAAPDPGYIYPAAAYQRDYYGVPPDLGRSYLHRDDVPPAAFERSTSYEKRYDAEPQRFDDGPMHRRPGYDYRSPSPARAPAYQQYEPSEWRNGRASPRAESSTGSRRSAEPTAAPPSSAKDAALPPGSRKGMRPDDSLAANEEVWQEHLRQFQQRRELEAYQVLRWTPAMGDGKPKKEPKIPVKRKGWPSDHPTRIAQRQAKEAALAAGIEIPKKKYKRKSKAAAIDDELLGLAEGDPGPSSPVPASSVADAEEREEMMPIPPPSSIILPCGLTRAEVITKVESGDIEGLTEDDVKQVQDEMWLKKNGPAALRKDGTMRKKPGPAKGWKAMRKAAKGDESDAGESVANGEAEADIAALLEESVDSPKPKPKAKRRTKKPVSDELVKSEAEDDEELELENGHANVHVNKKPRVSKHKEPGVGKGRWTRPPKEPRREEELLDEDNASEAGALAAPNTADPRGVSESEAKIRHGLVEELQRQAWVSIVRDVPKVCGSQPR